MRQKKDIVLGKAIEKADCKTVEIFTGCKGIYALILNIILFLRETTDLICNRCVFTSLHTINLQVLTQITRNYKNHPNENLNRLRGKYI